MSCSLIFDQIPFFFFASLLVCSIAIAKSHSDKEIHKKENWKVKKGNGRSLLRERERKWYEPNAPIREKKCRHNVVSPVVDPKRNFSFPFPIPIYIRIVSAERTQRFILLHSQSVIVLFGFVLHERERTK